jgi:hypothetical protein
MKKLLWSNKNGNIEKIKRLKIYYLFVGEKRFILLNSQAGFQIRLFSTVGSHAAHGILCPTSKAIWQQL